MDFLLCRQLSAVKLYLCTRMVKEVREMETFEEWSVLPKFPDKGSGTGKAGENVSADA
jgi:hypothetical protein